MVKKILPAATVVVLFACGEAPLLRAPTPDLDRQVFDLTIAKHREQFDLTGLTFVTSVAHYAVFKVEGPGPKMVLRPRVQAAAAPWAMLCGAGGYFAPGYTGDSAGTKPSGIGTVRVAMMGGSSGERKLISYEMTAQSGDCVDPGDVVKQVVRDDAPPQVEAEKPPEVNQHQILITFKPEPVIGSTVLFRAVGLVDDTPPHRPPVPRLCCTDGDDCRLEQPPEVESPPSPPSAGPLL